MKNLLSENRHESYASFAPAKFIPYQEAVEKLEIIKEKLCSVLSNKEYLLPIWCLYGGIIGAINSIRKLNDDVFSCHIPWDEEINFMSLPSFAADAQNGGEMLLTENKTATIVLSSFVGWQNLMNQKFVCWCRGKKSQFIYEILIHHQLIKEKDGFKVYELMGIHSENKNFIQHHFHFLTDNIEYPYYEQSKSIPDTNIIWRQRNKISFRHNFDISIEDFMSEAAVEIETGVIANFIIENIKEIQSLE